MHELIHRVGRVHRGEMRMRGENGEVVDVIRYRDKLGYDRKVYRLTRHGVFVGRARDAAGAGRSGRSRVAGGG